MDFLNGLVTLANFVLIPATSYGAQLALGALGVTLIYGILRFSNFAHGDTMAFGTAFVILFTWWFQSMGISFGPLPTALLALPFGIAATATMLLATDRVVYRFYRVQKAKPIILVIVSAGVMFVMNGLVRMIIGTSEKNFADGERFLISVRTPKSRQALMLISVKIFMVPTLCRRSSARPSTSPVKRSGAIWRPSSSSLSWRLKNS